MLTSYCTFASTIWRTWWTIWTPLWPIACYSSNNRILDQSTVSQSYYSYLKHFSFHVHYHDYNILNYYGIQNYSEFIFSLRCRKFRDILTMIVADWREFANDPFSKHVTTRMTSPSHRLSNVIIGLHMTAVMTYSFDVFLSDIEIIRWLFLFTHLYWNFDSNSSRMYDFVMITQFLHLLRTRAWSTCWNLHL